MYIPALPSPVTFLHRTPHRYPTFTYRRFGGWADTPPTHPTLPRHTALPFLPHARGPPPHTTPPHTQVWFWGLHARGAHTPHTLRAPGTFCVNRRHGRAVLTWCSGRRFAFAHARYALSSSGSLRCRFVFNARAFAYTVSVLPLVHSRYLPAVPVPAGLRVQHPLALRPTAHYRYTHPPARYCPHLRAHTPRTPAIRARCRAYHWHLLTHTYRCPAAVCAATLPPTYLVRTPPLPPGMTNARFDILPAFPITYLRARLRWVWTTPAFCYRPTLPSPPSLSMDVRWHARCALLYYLLILVGRTYAAHLRHFAHPYPSFSICPSVGYLEFV